MIAILQAVDLGTTYQILILGGREGNVFMQRIILTPMAPLGKSFALIFFALLIMRSTSRGRPSPNRLTFTAYVVLAAYVFVVANNVVTLFLVVHGAR